MITICWGGNNWAFLHYIEETERKVRSCRKLRAIKDRKLEKPVRAPWGVQQFIFSQLHFFSYIKIPFCKLTASKTSFANNLLLFLYSLFNICFRIDKLFLKFSQNSLTLYSRLRLLSHFAQSILWLLKAKRKNVSDKWW